MPMVGELVTVAMRESVTAPTCAVKSGGKV